MRTKVEMQGSEKRTVVDFDLGMSLVIRDFSGGELDSQVYAEYSDGERIFAECGYGKKLDYPYSTFTREEHGGLLEHVYNLTGYRLITVEDIVEGGYE